MEAPILYVLGQLLIVALLTQFTLLTLDQTSKAIIFAYSSVVATIFGWDTLVLVGFLFNPPDRLIYAIMAYLVAFFLAFRIALVGVTKESRSFRALMAFLFLLSVLCIPIVLLTDSRL